MTRWHWNSVTSRNWLWSLSLSSSPFLSVLLNDKSVLASHQNGPINATSQWGNDSITAFQHKSNERALPMFWSPSLELALYWNAEKCSISPESTLNTCAMCCCCCCSCLLAFRVSCLLFHLLVLRMEISFFQLLCISWLCTHALQHKEINFTCDSD